MCNCIEPEQSSTVKQILGFGGRTRRGVGDRVICAPVTLPFPRKPRNLKEPAAAAVFSYGHKFQMSLNLHDPSDFLGLIHRVCLLPCLPFNYSNLLHRPQLLSLIFKMVLADI